MEGKYSKQHLYSSEPLYQTYRATVITQEIRRQTVCRNISKTSMDFPVDCVAHHAVAGTGNGALRGGPVTTPGQSTLWQNLSNVRESGVLERLSPEECKYQEVSQEARVHRKGNSGQRLHLGFNRILK